MSKNNNYALITGASTGIGLALAHEFARHSKNVLLVARSEDKLKIACQEISEKYKVAADYIVFDLSEYSKLDDFYKVVDSRDLEIDTLVNNAGFGLSGDFVNLDLAKQIEMINLNVTSLVSLTHYFGQKFKTQRFGKILNIGSTLSFQHVPYMAVYNATKFFAFAFSIAVRKELESSNVNVTCFCPGSTTSEFFKDAGEKLNTIAKTQYKQTPQTVAKLAYRALEKNKDFEISGIVNKLMILALTRILPRKLVVDVTANMMKG